MNILSVGYPLACVGLDAVGGAEQVLASVDEALVRQGHTSHVVAPAGSRVLGELHAIDAAFGPLDEAAHREACHSVECAVQRVLDEHEVDVLHFHGLDFAQYLPRCDRPIVVTLHLPPSWYRDAALAALPDDATIVCVSNSQRAACAHVRRRIETIGNGVDTSFFTPGDARGGYALALGRICPEKGFHLALDAARAADRALVIAGRVYEYPDHVDYFDREVAPRLDRRRRFIGAADRARKRDLLAAADCLLVPSLAAETSSLVAMEALACGTPVIAFASGALPEIVEDGVTGFIVRDPDDMAHAMTRVGELDRTACRRAAVERFSHGRMTNSYLALYEQLAARGVSARELVA